MRIGIDGNEANVAKKVGISEYAFALLQEFSKMQSGKPQLQFFIYIKDNPRPDLPKETKQWKYIVVRPHRLWTQIGLPIYLFTHFPRPDVFFSPTHYSPRFSPVKTAIAIMDLSFLKFPELFDKKDLYQLKNWTKYSAQNAAKVFTISNASKSDIIKAYNLKSENVVVTHPGIKQESNDMNKNLTNTQLHEKYGISTDYILFVGTLQPRKNITKLIQAFSLIKRGKKAKDVKLVIVGKKGWLYEEILDAPKKFDVEDKVIFLDFVPDEDLPSLYTNALCYVLPSLYEGFGLPILEAMKYGCPVITSSVSSLPEAGGDAALYVNPENVEDIAEKIQKVISDPKQRASMKEKGYKHIKKFSWKKTAAETLAVLEKLGQS